MKQTYSTGAIWDPDTEGSTSKQIASAGREVTALKLATTESGSALVYLYDSASGTETDLKWIMDSPSDLPDSQVFPNPLNFRNGIYAVLKQGQNLGAILCIAVIHDQV